MASVTHPGDDLKEKKKCPVRIDPPREEYTCQEKKERPRSFGGYSARIRQS